MLSRAFAAQCFLVGLVVVGGCIVVVPDENKNGGGGGSSGSSSSNNADSGSSSSMSSSSGSSGSSGSSSSSSSTTQSQPTYSVYFYRDAYRHLPDMGETKKYIRAHGNRGQIDRGYFNGDLKFNGAGMIKEGAGHGETVIDGHCEVEGNNWRLTGITITGNLKVRGNENDLSGCEVFGDVDVRGMGNRTP
jgi:hypothetical protein